MINLMFILFIIFIIIISTIICITLLFLDLIQGGPKVSLHTLGLIAPPFFTFEGCCFANDILYLLVRGSRRQNLKIRIF